MTDADNKSLLLPLNIEDVVTETYGKALNVQLALAKKRIGNLLYIINCRRSKVIRHMLSGNS